MTVIDAKKPAAAAKERIAVLDVLRGAAMILVVIYHILYDMKYIYRFDVPRALTPGQPELEFVHTCFLWVLFGVSGICCGYSRDPLKRGAFLYIVGFLITVTTALFMPDELIVFGVLSCFGACMVITAFIKPLLDKADFRVILIISLLLWFTLSDLYRSGYIHLGFADIAVQLPKSCDFLYPIGIRGEHFKSSDYFPVIPYIFMFLSGHALYRPISEHKFPRRFYTAFSSGGGALGFIGRHSLIIYAVHQPLLILIFEILTSNG
ncbi:MAG: DUF1624 domain-containing protein [Ruminococcus sp.]|nr:DUF1624 domain-containing protein [Ruminococcus sp.]